MVLALLAGLVTFVLPSYILGLVEHPDGSYLSALLAKHQLKNTELHTPAFYADYIPAVARRLLLIGAALAGAVAYFATRGRGAWRAFWSSRGTPLNLALFRLVVLWQVYNFGLEGLESLTRMTADQMYFPLGYGWARGLMPPTMTQVWWLTKTYYVLAALGLFGVFSRVTLPLLTVVSFFALLGPQLVGKMNHYHQLWLALAVLAISPCADALAVDAIWARVRGRGVGFHQRALQYGRPITYVWAIIACVYFFPGFWKFVAAGMAWAFSDNVRLKILAKVFETGIEPTLPLYEYPVLCQLGGLGTLIFEIFFPLAVIFPLSRKLFAVGGIGFHEGNRLTLGISFDILERFYASFVDWSCIFRGRGERLPDVWPRWKDWFGSVIVGGLVVTGFLAIDGWPWAVFPTFAPIEQSFVNSMELKTLDDGHRYLLQDEPGLIDLYRGRTGLRAYLTLVMMERDEAARARMLQSLLDVFRRAHPGRAAVEFWQVKVPLLPRGAPIEPLRVIGRL